MMAENPRVSALRKSTLSKAAPKTKANAYVDGKRKHICVFSENTVTRLQNLQEITYSRKETFFTVP